MKNKLSTLVAATAIAWLGVVSVAEASGRNSTTIVFDAVVARPLCLAATVVGGAVFVVALPVAATSKSIAPTAEALVYRPARATFTRPLGDFDDLEHSGTVSVPARKMAAGKRRG
jgi:hypothetical protein